MKLRTRALAALILLMMLLPALPRPANATCCSCTATVLSKEIQEWLIPPEGTTPKIKMHVSDEFKAHRRWFVSTLFEDNILPAMMLMAEQLSAVAMQQVFIIGTFLDAKHQMETQQLLQKMQARAHKDYHPSVGMCEFGSAIKSLAATERRGEYNAIVLSARSQDRALGNAYTSAAPGEFQDQNTRLKQFREKFCDPRDNNNGLTYLCDHDGVGGSDNMGAEGPQRMNADIDYGSTIDYHMTIDVYFDDSTINAEEQWGPNEEAVFALASNLYGHYTFPRIPGELLESPLDETIILNPAQKLYMDVRAHQAKNSVAENSFNAIVGMKARGTQGSQDYLFHLLRELGIPSGDEVEFLLTATPSYDAQMEILAKKIYQNPNFYTNLYDKPANVVRKGVALQAIGLMQKFDLFKSNLRSEASLSVLLELAVSDLQQEIENELPQMSGTGTPAPR